MKKLLAAGAIGALAVAFAPAVAQPAPPPPPGVAQGVAPLAPPASRQHVRMNMMSNHTMTRAEAVQHVARMFPRLDTNHDGFITRDEVDAIYRKMMSAMASGDAAGKLRERAKFMGDRGAMFHRLDTNHDGNISRQEFMTARPQVREQRMIVMREGGTLGAPGMGMRMHGMGGGMHFGGRLFDMADANKDGRVSLAEAQAAALAHFDKADLNHDGKITPDERQQMHRLRGERRQG